MMESGSLKYFVSGSSSIVSLIERGLFLFLSVSVYACLQAGAVVPRWYVSLDSSLAVF